MEIEYGTKGTNTWWEERVGSGTEYQLAIYKPLVKTIGVEQYWSLRYVTPSLRYTPFSY